MKSVRHRRLSRFLAIAYLWPAVKILLARPVRSLLSCLPLLMRNLLSPGLETPATPDISPLADLKCPVNHFLLWLQT